jgi:transposase
MINSEATRYAEFCQFRDSVRGSDHHLIIGIDVAKDRHHAFFGTATGKSLLRRLIFDNNRAGFESLTDRARQLMATHSCSHAVYGLEPTGNYHKPLASWLLEHGHMLVLVTNKAIADNRESLDGRWDKNDTKDSANVADLVAQGKCQFYENASADLVALRGLLSLRKRLKKSEHRIRMQIRNGLLSKFFPEMDRLWGSCLHENLAIVRWCLDPRKIATMTFDDFLKRVTRRDRGLRQIKRLRAIYDVAKISVGCRVDQAAEFEARLLVEQLTDLRERLEQTESRIASVCERFTSYKRLLSIPGFGPYVSAQVLARIGDANRFAGRKQVIRLAGFDLNAKRSGKYSHTAVPVISKRGNAELRYALYQAALIATYHNDGFRALFTRWLQGRERERGIRTKMRVKLASKMLVIAWRLMQTDMDYDPSLLQVSPMRG